MFDQPSQLMISLKRNRLVQCQFRRYNCIVSMWYTTIATHIRGPFQLFTTSSQFVCIENEPSHFDWCSLRCCLSVYCLANHRDRRRQKQKKTTHTRTHWRLLKWVFVINYVVLPNTFDKHIESSILGSFVSYNENCLSVVIAFLFYYVYFDLINLTRGRVAKQTNECAHAHILRM